MRAKRRTRGDYVQVFRILSGIDNVEKAHFFVLDDGGGYSLRGQRIKLKVERSRLQLRQGFFSHRTVKLWKMLPASVVEASTVRTFQNRLDD